MNEPDFNLEEIANGCDLYSGKTDDVIAKIDGLENSYDEDSLVVIYNYFLSKSQNPDVLMYLIRCCDKYRKDSTLEFLVDILLLKNVSSAQEELKEKFQNVRIMCAKAIGNLKNPNAVSSLLYCMNNKDENYRIRLACADSLGRIGDRYAVVPLIEVVNDEDEKSVYLKESATRALGLLGDSRAIEPLVKLVEAKQGIMDKFSFLKERAIEALNKMGAGASDRVFKALKNSLLDESPQVRIDAIEGLMNSEHPDAFDIIKKCLTEDDNAEVKKNALIALYNMSDRSILDEVINSPQYSDTLKINAVELIEEYENEGTE